MGWQVMGQSLSMTLLAIQPNSSIRPSARHTLQYPSCDAMCEEDSIDPKISIAAYITKEIVVLAKRRDERRGYAMRYDKRTSNDLLASLPRYFR